MVCLSYHFNGPAWSRDAILTLTRIELDFVSEVETHLFLEKCMRGGSSYVSKRYSKANTKYLTFYNPKNWLMIICAAMPCQNLFQRADVSNYVLQNLT